MSRTSLLLENPSRPFPADEVWGVRWLLDGALLLAGGVVLLSYLTIAWAHLNDRYEVNFVSGIYAGLAEAANRGVFYPPLFDGEHYAGTRYGPGHFVSHAILARLTGEYLRSGKLLTYGLTLVLVAQLLVILRRLRCSPSLAVALTAMVFISGPTFSACTGIRGDLMSVVLQLGALISVDRRMTPARAASAALLSAMAFLTKISAVWAPIAITLWTIRSDRRMCLVFVVMWLASIATALGVCHVASNGRILDNFQALSGAGVQFKGLLLSPALFVWRQGQSGLLLAVAVPSAALEIVRAGLQRRWTLYHMGLATCLPVMLLLYSDMGAYTNHLVDWIILCVVIAGSLIVATFSCEPRADVQTRPGRVGLASDSIARTALALGLSWVLYVGWVETLAMPSLHVVQAIRDGRSPASTQSPAKPLTNLISDDEVVLSEDPWVSLARGRQPVVLDAFSLARISEKEAAFSEPLKGRIAAREFTKIVTLQDIDNAEPLDRVPWEVRHFGPAIVQAIRTNYRLERQAEGYFVYVPRPVDAVP